MEEWRNLWRNDRRRNVFEQVARHDDFVVDGDGESVIGIHFQPVDVRLVVAVFLLELAVVRLFRRRAFRDLSSDWILVAEDEVQLVIGATLVRPEHDRERRFVVEVDQVVVRLAQQLHVAAATLDSVLEGDFVLRHEVGLESKRLVEIVRKSVVRRFLFDNKSLKFKKVKEGTRISIVAD